MEDVRIENELHGEIGSMMLTSIIKKSLIKATDTYATPPQIIWVDSSVIATLGNFSASTGKAKAKKTFNVSAIVAAALTSGQVLNYRAQLPDGKQRILYVDTEQSRYHCHKVLERILRLASLPTDTDSNNLDFLCLREYSPATRMQVIEYALSQDDSYGLVIIDGIRDLLVDINNAGESTIVINKMMEWSSRYDLHIHCVLHQNKADNNVRGHIGTEMNNKAETVIVVRRCDANPNVSEVSPMHIREKEFSTFAFQINEDGLPEIASDYEHDEDSERGQRTTFKTISIEQHRDVMRSIMGEHPIKGFENVVKAMIPAYENIGFKRGRSVMIRTLKYLIEELKIVVRIDNLYYCESTPHNPGIFDAENDDE